MNKRLLTIMLAGTILSAGNVMAQNAPAVSAGKDAAVVSRMDKMKRFGKKHHQEMAKRLSEDLDLTAEQKAKADKVREEGRKKIEPLMEKMMKLRAQIDQERRANMEEFENILTPEQKQRFEALKERGPRRFDRHPGEIMPRNFDRRPGDLMPPRYNTMPDQPDPDKLMRGMHRVHPDEMPYNDEGILPPSHDEGMMPRQQKDFRYSKHKGKHGRRYNGAYKNGGQVGGFVADEELTDEAIEVDQGGFVEE